VALSGRNNGVVNNHFVGAKLCREDGNEGTPPEKLQSLSGSPHLD